MVYAISGGREPQALWAAARQSYADDAELFAPHIQAHAKPAALGPRLQSHGLSQKPTSDATVWQRIGHALVMRAGGYVAKLLADHEADALKLLAMLAHSKTTFPVLSGAQTAPRWLNGITAVAQYPLQNSEQLAVPVSPAAARALDALALSAGKVSAAVFEAVGSPALGPPAKKTAPSEICVPY